MSKKQLASKIYCRLYRKYGRKGLRRQYNYHGCGRYSVDFFLGLQHLGTWNL